MLFSTNSLDKFLLLCEVSQKSIGRISRYLEISIKRDAWAEDSEKKPGNFGGRKSGISDWKKLFNLVVNPGTSRCPTDYLAVDLELVQTTRNVQCISQFHLRKAHNLTREFIDDVISVISFYYFIDVFLSI